MKNLSEYILDQKLNEHLLDDIILCTQCRWNVQMMSYSEYIVPYIFESKGHFDKCGLAIQKIYNQIKDQNKYENVIIDCSELELFFKTVTINFTKDKNSSLLGAYVSCNTSNVNIELITNFCDTWTDELEYLLLHELMHAYEDWTRKKSGKQSIFTDFSLEYKRAALALRMNKDDIQKNLARCKYFLNDHERNAYLGTLEETIKNVTKKVHPKWTDLKFDKVLETIQNEYIWKEYFELNKFILNFEDFEYKLIEQKYNSLYCNFSNKKSYREIKKEIESKWKKFKYKFEELFSKIYCDQVWELHEGLMPSFTSNFMIRNYENL